MPLCIGPEYQFDLSANDDENKLLIVSRASGIRGRFDYFDNCSHAVLSPPSHATFRYCMALLSFLGTLMPLR